MEFEDTGLQGSFAALGVGLFYKYQDRDRCLDIMDPAQGKALAQFHFDTNTLERPKVFVRHLDRANQIKALIFSNNKTNNLCETMDERKVGAILRSTAKSSRFTTSLETLDFGYFAKGFAEDAGLKSLRIKRFVSNGRLNEFYVGRIQTHNDNSISVRACTLPQLLSALAEGTVRDLVTAEYSCKTSARNLLNASTRLSFLSCILDENYIPENSIKYDAAEPNRIIC